MEGEMEGEAQVRVFCEGERRKVVNGVKTCILFKVYTRQNSRKRWSVWRLTGSIWISLQDF